MDSVVDTTQDVTRDSQVPLSGREAHRIKKMIQKVKRILSFDKANKLLWMPKAIAVASAYCYYDYFYTILKDLYLRFK